MKKVITILLLLVSFPAYAAEPEKRDFKLLPPRVVGSAGNSASIQESLANIRRRLNELERRMDECCPPKSRPTVTEGRPIAGEGQEYRPPVIRATPQGPPADGGPTWKYDPTTGNYYRYVPASAIRGSPRYDRPVILQGECGPECPVSPGMTMAPVITQPNPVVYNYVQPRASPIMYSSPPIYNSAPMYTTAPMMRGFGVGGGGMVCGPFG